MTYYDILLHFVEKNDAGHALNILIYMAYDVVVIIQPIFWDGSAFALCILQRFADIDIAHHHSPT